MIRLASTVMMLRPGGPTFEVFMLRRSAASPFAPDVFAFPGGAVDAADYETRALGRIAGLDDRRLARSFRAQQAPLLEDAEDATVSLPDGRALFVAAIRETFEEAGVLLGARRIAHVDLQALHAARIALGRGETSFMDVLASFDLSLDASDLEFFSQWITPPSEGRRFNAHFFIARADEQHAIADRFETHDEIWISPQDALARCESGSHAMVYPTIKHIERLAEFSQIDDVMAFSKNKPILRIMPKTTADNGFTLPRSLESIW